MHFPHRVNTHDVDPESDQLQVHLADPLIQKLFVLFAPLFDGNLLLFSKLALFSKLLSTFFLQQMLLLSSPTCLLGSHLLECLLIRGNLIVYEGFLGLD